MGMPADQIQALLAPYLQAGPSQGTPSQLGTQFGGLGNLGMALMANSGPSRVPQRFGSILGNSMLQAQNNALDQAQKRQQMTSNSIGMARQMAMMPMIMRALQNYNDASGDGSQPTSSTGNGPAAPSDASAPDASQGPQATSGMSPAMIQRLSAAGSGAPPGAAPLNAPNAAPSGAGAMPQGQGSAAPPGAPMGPRQIAPPGGSGQLPPGFNAMRQLNAAGGLALAGLPGAAQLVDVAKTRLQYDPAVTTQQKAAGSDLAVDQLMMQTAAQKGDSADYQAAHLKYLKDSGQITVDRYGNVVTLGGVKPTDLGISTFLPQQGVQTGPDGRMSLIPGAATTLQQKAGAEALGKAQGELTEVTDANGNKYSIPKSTLLGGAASAGGTAGPISAAGSVPSGAMGATPGNTSELGPASEELLKSKGEQAGKSNEEYQSQAEAGQQMLVQIAELKSAASDFTPGQFAESRMKALQWLQSTDLITPKEANQLGSAQAGQKIAIQLQAAAVKQLGSREAAQVFQVMGKSLPNLTLSPDGMNKVSAYMSGIARYNIARGQMSSGRFAQNDANGVNNVRNEFIANTNPTYFILASAPASTRQEMLSSMGGNAKQFLMNWNTAIKGGWAPPPGAYDGANP